MAKAVKKEVAIIEFEKFSVAQLPELQGKKEEIKSIIEANPIVEIIDNASYELAKKSRTAVRSLRTGLEAEQKTVKKKIKEYVLDVVDSEYDTLVLGVKSAEKERQDPIDTWEIKKEEERKEKIRLEELRVKNIKDAIQTFSDEWEETFSLLTLERISDCEELFGKTVGEFDREKLAEFEVLFDDAVSTLNKLFDAKCTTLKEQEQIRLDNIILEEKHSEMAKISQFEKNWSANIDTLKFEDISPDLRDSLEKDKLADLKHYQQEFDDKHTSIENRLNAQIEFVSKQEAQRLVEEKLKKEKEEFEAKQAEAKFQERKKFLVDEEYWRIYLLAECGEEEDVAKGKLLNFTDLEFEDFKSAVLKAKEPVNPFENVEFEEEPIQSEPIVVENQYNVQASYDEDDVHEVAAAKNNEIGKIISDDYKTFSDMSELVDEKKHDSLYPITPEEAFKTKEITWESIYKEWDKHNHPQKNESSVWLIWLSTHYNVPIRK